MALFAMFFAKIKTKWPRFIGYVKKAADPDDRNQIFLDQFVYVLKRFAITLSEK